MVLESIEIVCTAVKSDRRVQPVVVQRASRDAPADSA